jgi:hypothetical protein
MVCVGLVVIFVCSMITLLYVGARMASKPVERYVCVYSSDDPPPPDGELVWYYNPSLIPAWRHALYLDGRWLEYSGGLLDESPKLPPHQGWMPDPFPAAN